ncbi:MAG: dipeptide ABC transporter ATP-binding protein [Deltaproteobacteria bacterium]|nr:dipeptide ABC transporter ATP-binding protein [Deltaproteobacteria bacterium]MBT4638364.1 dipeptide ABC transporter ATP-binding protein [Deltaproteobacteria bacterium]MBT6501360.1 dipeptide ABC transporter ATP-binding protein [Deltaproteobacteria bacterium]MBT7155044.1 dipeptide ABC transporter ATP-binding protein [Deltaproteobacteria bacterium]MBT7716590.1 dipeptide ABC transporter ATP-binding protein [Deltaproteobacteria bacterium]
MQPLVECCNLKKYFQTGDGVVQAVDDISFTIQPGETIGLVGESGCGKSTIGRTMLKLVEPNAGKLLFKGRNIYEMNRQELQSLRREMGIIFQNPYSSLNPRMKVLDIVGEPLKTHTKIKGKERKAKVLEYLSQVGLKPEHLNRFPHQFSGGQRQRIAIARSLTLNPSFLILDEPTSALDVSVQAQVLNLIRDLQIEKDLTYLFITHDLHVVKHIAGRILVMYLGKLVESGPVEAVFNNPRHPYTQALLSAIPNPNPSVRKKRTLLEGDVPSPINPPKGCRFHTRCPKVQPQCREKQPETKSFGEHQVACFLA